MNWWHSLSTLQKAGAGFLGVVVVCQLIDLAAGLVNRIRRRHT
jgi:hypothetical protein